MAHGMGGGFGGGSFGSGGLGGRTYSSIPRAGCTKYLFTDKRGHKRSFYASVEPKRSNPWNYMTEQGITALVIIVGILVVGFSMTKSAFYSIVGSEPLIGTEKYFTGEYIDDEINILNTSDENLIEQSFIELRDKSGIIPYIKTVYLEDVSKKKLESSDDYAKAFDKYGLRYYKENFKDEAHVLIIYSVRESDKSDWYWYQVQGDNVDSIITNGKFEDFQDDMQENLKNESLSAGEAISKSVYSMIPHLFESNYSDILWIKVTAGVGAVILLIFAVKGLLGVRAQYILNAYLESPEYKKIWHQK